MTFSEAIEKEADNILPTFLAEIHDQQHLAEGKRRGAKGRLGEKFAKLMISAAGRIVGVSDRLELNNLKFPYDHVPKNPKGHILLSEIEESNKKRKKSGEDTKGIPGLGSDLFVYLREPHLTSPMLVAVVEAKTYCDISMLKRGYSEFESLTSIVQTPPAFFVFQIENALSGDVENDAVCHDMFRTGHNTQSFLHNRQKLLGGKAPKFSMLTVRNAKRNGNKEICENTPFEKERICEIIQFWADFLKNKIDA